MKTTLDLPEELVREMKVRAASEGRKLREVATEIFRRGLAMPEREPLKGKRVKLPLFHGKKPVNPAHEMTPERVDEILLEQEVEWLNQTNEASGH